MAGRVRHPIDVAALEAYLGTHAPEVRAPVEVRQFGFGQSNPTYQLTGADGRRFVLRKKPPGKLLSQAAHKVEREYRVLAALGPTAVPTPRTHCLCEDAAVVGTPFYIMEFLDGRIFEDPALPGLTGTGTGIEGDAGKERHALWRDAVRTLAALHAVDAPAVGLAGFGRSDGFYGRQLATWRRICDAQARATDADTGRPVGPLPHFDDLLAFFADPRAAPRDRAALIHGDYKLDNLVFDPREPRVLGILDWEMSTVGHPLSDLANLMHPFYLARGAVVLRHAGSSEAFLPDAGTPGLPTPDEILGWYRDAAGWDPAPDMDWAVAFSVFRLAAICQGIAARVATRQASSEQARQHADAMFPLAEFAWSLAQKAQARLDARPADQVPAKL